MPSLGSHTLVPRTVCGRVDESTLAVTLHAPILPVCSFVAPGRSLLTATGSIGYARALRVTAHGHDDCARADWPSRGPE